MAMSSTTSARSVVAAETTQPTCSGRPTPTPRRRTPGSRIARLARATILGRRVSSRRRLPDPQTSRMVARPETRCVQSETNCVRRARRSRLELLAMRHFHLLARRYRLPCPEVVEARPPSSRFGSQMQFEAPTVEPSASRKILNSLEQPHRRRLFDVGVTIDVKTLDRGKDRSKFGRRPTHHQVDKVCCKLCEVDIEQTGLVAGCSHVRIPARAK